MLIVGITIVILVGYTLFIRLTSDNGESIIAVAFFIAMHFALCLLLALVPYSRKGFLLSAAAVVLIGFSTCYIAYGVH